MDRIRSRLLFGAVLCCALMAEDAGTQKVPQYSQQCYRYRDEPPDTCSICRDQCLGSGFVCCGIIAYPT